MVNGDTGNRYRTRFLLTYVSTYLYSNFTRPLLRVSKMSALAYTRFCKTLLEVQHGYSNLYSYFKRMCPFVQALVVVVGIRFVDRASRYDRDC